MELEVRLPQIDTVIAKIDELDKKLDALALAAAATAPVSQPEPATPTAPARRGRQRKAAEIEILDVKPIGVENGEDTNVEDEDALRARVEFEANARRAYSASMAQGRRSAASLMAPCGSMTCLPHAYQRCCRRCRRYELAEQVAAAAQAHS